MNSDKKRILILSPFFYPEPISTGKFNTDLALKLAEKGHKVTVLCSHPFYPNWKPKKSSEQLENITIIRGGKNIKYSNKTVIRRFILEFWYMLFIIKRIKRYQKNIDIIIPVFPPSLAFYTVLPFLKKQIKKIGMVHDLQQVYSSNKKGFFNKLISFFIYKVERKCFNSCNKLIFLSEEMKQEAKNTYKLNSNKLEVQYPFVTISKNKTEDLKELLNSNHIHIVYSGALGEKQNPSGLYEAFNYASQNIKNSEFHFFSQGSIFETLKSKNKNAKIKFHSLVPKKNIEELYYRSTVQIVPQLPNTSKGSLPSKLPNLLASGCQILVITDSNSEIENLFKEYSISTVINSWDKKDITKSLMKITNKVSNTNIQKKIASQLFSLDRMMDRILN